MMCHFMSCLPYFSTSNNYICIHMYIYIVHKCDGTINDVYSHEVYLNPVGIALGPGTIINLFQSYPYNTVKRLWTPIFKNPIYHVTKVADMFVKKEVNSYHCNIIIGHICLFCAWLCFAKSCFTCLKKRWFHLQLFQCYMYSSDHTSRVVYRADLYGLNHSQVKYSLAEILSAICVLQSNVKQVMESYEIVFKIIR